MILDLTSVKKPVLTIKLFLNNNTETTINVLPASKKLIDKMSKVKSSVTDLYQIVADVLSCNTEARAVSVDDISEVNIIDIANIFKAYKSFIEGINSDPN